MFVRVYSINLHMSRDPNAVRQFILNEMLNNKKAIFVIGLQEADCGAARSDYVNAVEVVAGGAMTDGGQPQYFARAIAFDQKSESLLPHTKLSSPAFEYGIGLVSTHPIVYAHRVELGPQEELFWLRSVAPTYYDWEVEPRVAIIAKINTPAGPLWVINTHLAYTPDRTQHSPFRATQIETLMNEARKTIPANSPVILMGDFNATPDNPDLQPLFKMFHCVTTSTPTYTNSKGEALKIDYLCARGMTSLGQMAPVRTYYSDHCISRGLFKLRH